MITLDFIHIVAIFGIAIAMYGKLFMKMVENSQEINDLKARVRECERWRENYERNQTELT